METPFCNAVFIERDEFWNDMYDTLTREQLRLFSDASLDAMQEILGAWPAKPGALCVRLGHEGVFELGVESLSGDDGYAWYHLPLRDVIIAGVLSGDRAPDEVSAMLRKLANEVEGL